MEDLDQLELLPSVAEIPSMTPTVYRIYAQGVIKNREHCDMAEAFDILKLVDWCKYLNCFNECRIPLHPSEITTVLK